MILSRKILNYAQLALLVLLAAFPTFAGGEIDAGFHSSAYGSSNGAVSAVKIQPDGKILVGGSFLDAQGYAVSGLGRFNTDGSIDTAFSPPDFFNGITVGSYIYTIGLQSDGKIIVGGDIYGTDGVLLPGRVRRLNPDGSLDPTFNLYQFSEINGKVYDLEVAADNKILIGGDFGIQTSHIVRLNADGTLDNTFQAPSTQIVRDIDLQPDGKVLIGTTNNISSSTAGTLRRLNSNGTADGTFAQVNTNSTIEAVKLLPDGKVLIGGLYSLANGFNQGRFSRINTDGTLDLNFNLNNPGTDGGIYDIALRSDGKIVIGGTFTVYNQVARQKVAQLNSDGTLDMSFLNNTALANFTINDVEIQADGKILAAAPSTPFNTALNPLLRIVSDGTFDTGFDARIRGGGKVQRIMQQPDGKILIGGTFTTVNGVTRSSLARLNTDGSVDTSFVPYFNGCCGAGGPPVLGSLVLQPDGKILVIASGVGFVRLNSDGSLDPTFTSSGTGSVLDVAVLPNGQILIVGGISFTNSNIIQRLNANGSLDTTPLVLADAIARKVIVQPDGKILIGGSFTQVGGFFRGRVTRLNADFSLDNTFNPPGGANGDVNDMDLQPDGKVLVAGAFTGLNGNNNIQSIGRLNGDGTLDSSFVQKTNSILFGVKVQPDGKVLIAGSMSTVGNQLRVGIARLNADGSVDLTFDSSANRTVWDVNLQTDGKILVGGEFSKIKGTSQVRIGRLLNAAAPSRTLFDYDGDGKADISVFRPSENKWYVFRSSDSAVSQQIFAIAGDVPVPADYDGDGKTDLAIFRPSSGDWWSLSSVNGAQVFAHWGASGDVPRPSDFDGDGRTDYVVFRPAEGNWYRLSSGSGLSSNGAFGLSGDKPVTGDFDGDGKSDKAIFRPSTGDWWWQSSVDNGQRATRWGIATDIPAPADFDGDGKTDFAVYRPSSGTWYIINSSNGSFTIMNFGISEDKPIAGDYDGDGKADIAVFRPSTGVWYAMRTTQGFTAVQFGISSDVPTENAFVP